MTPENATSTEAVKVAAVPERWAGTDQGREVGLPTPETINFMMAVAEQLVGSALCTPDMLKFNGPAALYTELQLTARQIVKANAMAKMLAGYEMGIPAIEALRTVHVVKGKIFVAYEKLLSIMHAKGYQTKWIKADTTQAVLNVWHPDGRLGPDGYTTSFDEAKATAAGLNRDFDSGEKSMYSKRPDVMYRARCASDAYRVVGAGPTLYTFEEEREVAASMERDEDAPSQPKPEATAPEGKYTAKPKAPKVNGPPPPTPQPPVPAPPETVDFAHIPTLIYGIYVIPAGGKATHLPREDQAKRENAIIRAQALANETGLTHNVVDLVTGEILVRCNPPTPIKQDTGQGSKAEPPVNEGPGDVPRPQNTPAAPEAPATVKTTTRTKPPAAPAEARQVILDRYNQAIAGIKALPEAVDIDIKVISKAVLDFLTSYLGVAKLPMEESAYVDVFPDLESAMRHHLREVLSNPAGVGKRMSDDNICFEEFFKRAKESYGWSTNTSSLGRTLARTWGLDSRDFNAMMAAALGKDWDYSATNDDVMAFFRLALRTRDAGKLWKSSFEHNLSMAKSVAEMEYNELGKQRIEDIASKHVEAAIAKAIERIKQTAAGMLAPKKPRTATPSDPPEPDPDDIGLASIFANDEPAPRRR